MRFLLASGVLLVTVVATSAIYKPRDLVKLLNPKIGNFQHFIQKRQSQDCINAYLETQEPEFQECSQIFSEVDDITVDEMTTFCEEDNCVSLMIKVFTDFENCGEISENTTQQALQYLNLFCTKNSNNDYCLKLAAAFNSGTLQFPDDINYCDPTSTRCSNACKNVAEWIKTKLGCCYLTIAQIYPEEGDFTSQFFTNCGQPLTTCD